MNLLLIRNIKITKFKNRFLTFVSGPYSTAIFGSSLKIIFWETGDFQLSCGLQVQCFCQSHENQACQRFAVTFIEDLGAIYNDANIHWIVVNNKDRHGLRLTIKSSLSFSKFPRVSPTGKGRRKYTFLLYFISLFFAWALSLRFFLKN